MSIFYCIVTLINNHLKILKSKQVHYKWHFPNLIIFLQNCVENYQNIINLIFVSKTFFYTFFLQFEWFTRIFHEHFSFKSDFSMYEMSHFSNITYSMCIGKSKERKKMALSEEHKNRRKKVGKRELGNAPTPSTPTSHPHAHFTVPPTPRMSVETRDRTLWEKIVWKSTSFQPRYSILQALNHVDVQGH